MRSNQRWDRLRKTLRKFELRLAEYAVLNLISFESRYVRDVPTCARGLLYHTSLPVPSTTACRDAIEALVNRQFVRVVDFGIQAEISRAMQYFDGVGPTDGVPIVGQLDFTAEGAGFWRELINWQMHDYGKDHFWNGCSAVVRRRSSTVLITFDLGSLFDELNTRELQAFGEPVEIGKWRMEWWREIPSGYTMQCVPEQQ